MKKLAKDLGFVTFPGSWACKYFPKLCDIFGRYKLEGNLRGKQLKIFSTFGKHQVGGRLVVQTAVNCGKDCQIIVKRKPIFWNAYKVFDKNFVQSNDPILDSKLIFSSDNQEIFSKILGYEEICEQMYAVWPVRSSRGEMIISENFITYHEPFWKMSAEVRERVKNAANLICDISDVIKIS